MWRIIWLFEIEMEDNRLGYQDVYEVLQEDQRGSICV